MSKIPFPFAPGKNYLYNGVTVKLTNGLPGREISLPKGNYYVHDDGSIEVLDEPNAGKRYNKPIPYGVTYTYDSDGNPVILNSSPETTNGTRTR